VTEATRDLTFLDSEQSTETPTYYRPSRHPDEVPAILLRIPCREPAGVPCVGFLQVDGGLVQIGLWPNYPVTFEDAIDAIGQPDFAALYPVGAESVDMCDIALYWRDPHLVAYHRNFEGLELCSLALQDMLRVPYGLQVHEVFIADTGDFEGAPSWQWGGYLDQE
jgi:hypothetical protein